MGDRQIIQSIDANFDGYPDLVIFENTGGAGPNSSYNYFLFDPTIGRFVRSEELSELTQPQIDPKTKSVQSFWRDGAATHGAATYAWIHGKLVCTSSVETTYLDEAHIRETTQTLRHGKMHTRVRMLRAPSEIPRVRRRK